MSSYLGDFVEDETLHFIWSSFNSDGASVTRATDGTISVYKDNGLTQSTAGITDTEDFDGLTGLHACTIDLSADAFYATGADYSVVLSAATIDGQTVNTVLREFSIQNRYMRGTDGANTSTPLDAAGVRTAIGLASANLDTQLSTIAGYIDTEIAAILVDTGTTLDGKIDAIKTVVDGILVDTGTDGVALTTAERNAVADAILDRDMAAGTDSGSATTRTVRQALRFLRNKWSISGTTLTVTEEDDTTASWASEISTDANADPITGNDPASS